MSELQNKKIAILGIGGHFNRNRSYIDPTLSIICYADNNPDKWGTIPYENGIKCVNPGELKNMDIDLAVIGVKKGIAYDQLEDTAKKMGLPVCSLDSVVNEYIDAYEEKRRELEKAAVSKLFEGSGRGHRLILINTPQVTSTIGDHAISTAEVLFLKKYFPECQLIEIGDRFFWDNRDEIKRNIYPSDVLLIQGGGYLGSLWRMWREDTVRYVLQSFTMNPIIILPQTMYFEASEDGRLQKSISESIYNSHGNLIMCFREENSFQLSMEILDNVPHYLIPDTVTSMEYTGPLKEKKAVAFCFKNDKETLVSREKQNNMILKLQEMGFDVVNTTMFLDKQIHSSEEREQIVRQKMEELAGYRLVITDAMHGMVLSAVSGTACIGVESITGKVGGVYQWLKDLPYVEYAESPFVIDDLINKIRPYMDKHNHYERARLSSYFKQLTDIIGDALRP